MKKFGRFIVSIFVLLFVLAGFSLTKAAGGVESEVDQAIYVDSYNKSLSISNYFPIAQNFMPNKDVTTGFSVYIKFGNSNNLEYTITQNAKFVASGSKQVTNSTGWEYFSLSNDVHLNKNTDYTLYLRSNYSPMAWTYTELNIYQRGYAIKEGKAWLEGDFGLITYGYDQSNSNPDSNNSSSNPSTTSTTSTISEESAGDGTSSDTNSSSTIANNSENKAENSQNKDTTAPQIPKNLSVSENNGMLILKWDKNIENDMAYYLLTVYLENNNSPVITKKIDKEENAYIISGLDLSKKYVIELQALDQSGNASGAQKISWQKQITNKENFNLFWIIFGGCLIAILITYALLCRYKLKNSKKN